MIFPSLLFAALVLEFQARALRAGVQEVTQRRKYEDPEAKLYTYSCVLLLTLSIYIYIYCYGDSLLINLLLSAVTVLVMKATKGCNANSQFVYDAELKHTVSAAF